MVIPACANRRWEQNATCINSLPYADEVTAAGYFTDEDGGKSFSAQFLVYAHIVDL